MEAERRFAGWIEAGRKCRRAASSSVKVPTTLVRTKSAGTVDRAVDMAFGRQMHDRVGVMRLEHLAHGGGVGDVGADQGRWRW